MIQNPKPMALWSAMMAAILAVGTALAFVTLMVAVPVLGHAALHLYRKVATEV